MDGDMARARAIIQIPPRLAHEMDRIAGSRRRSEFATAVLEREVRRNRLLQLFKNPEPIWKDRDHPELGHGTEAWVRSLREESEGRLAGTPKPRRKR